MKSRIACCALVVVLAATLSVQAQQKHTIKLKKSAQGDSAVVEKIEAETNTTKLTDKDNKEQDFSQPKKETKVVYRETILEKKADARIGTKVKRHYEVATVTTGGKTTTLPYQGKTVLIEKKEGDYHFTIEGGDELKKEDAALLRKEFNKKKESEPDLEKVMLPKGPIAVGETWQMDKDAIAKEIRSSGEPLEIDESGIKGTGKLLKVYEKDGRQFGVMRMELTFPIKSVKGLDIEKGAATASGDMDVCIDGSAHLGTVNGVFEFAFRGKISGQDARVESSTRVQSTEVYKAPK